MTVTSRSNSHSDKLITVLFSATVFGGIALAWSHHGRKRQQQQRQQQAEAHLWKFVENSFSGALIYVGDKLNLYETIWKLAEADTQRSGCTSKELAAETGYDERWLREWLYQTAAAGICSYDEKSGRFALKSEYATFLRGPEKEVQSLAGMFPFLQSPLARSDATAKSIETGRGVDYDFGPDVCAAIDRENRNFFKYKLCKEIIEKVKIPCTGEDLVSVLNRGVNVADVGCGCGSSTIAMAKKFPASHFFAYELSPRSLAIMREQVAESGLSNITICDVSKRGVGDGPMQGAASGEENVFHFVYTHDVLHDMANPVSLIHDVKKRLSDDGCWIIVDVECHDSFSDNLKLPQAALNYGFSCLLCLASATSEENGEGLGTMGFNTNIVRKWTKAAGFQHCKKMKILSKPGNSCFIVSKGRNKPLEQEQPL